MLQKALDCEEDIRLLIVSELLLGDPAQTLVNKHASHVWSKVLQSNFRSTSSEVFTAVALLDYGIVLDSPRASDFHLVRSIIYPQQRKQTEQPISSVNKSLKGKWASLACHETGSLVVQVQTTFLIIKRLLIHFIACV